MFFILGACLGSFFCVVAERMPKRQNFWSTRSQCPHCKHTLAACDLIPIVSFIWLKGTCRICKTKIPLLYLVAEVSYGIGLSLIFLFFDLYTIPLPPLFYWLTSAFLLSLIDSLYQEIDSWLLYASTAILWYMLWIYRLPFSWPVLGLCLALYLLLKHSIYIGEADLLLFLSWFPWLTLTEIYFLVLFASLSGVLYALIKWYLDKEKPAVLPFIPFLTIGLFLTLWI